MKLRYDREADAAYIQLRDAPYAFGQMLDLDRNIDFGPDEQPIGVEILGVSHGVILDNLPERDAIARLLSEHSIEVVA